MTSRCKGGFPCAPNCPLASAHGRLREAHHHWHAALDEYQDPELFRIHLNACIQALRNSTFAVQKAGGSAANFKEWYGPEQDAMRADSVLRWLVDSRNRIVKEEDLRLQSLARAWISLSYEDIMRNVQHSAASELGSDPRKGEDCRGLAGSDVESFDPLTSVRSIGEELVDRIGVPLSTVDRGIFTVERTWIDSNLPGWEVLAALGHCYSHISGVVERAHLAFDITRTIGIWRGREGEAPPEGVPSSKGAPGSYDEVIDLSSTVGSLGLPCMQLTGSIRSKSYHLLTGEALDYETTFAMSFDPKLWEEAKALYSLPDASAAEAVPSDVGLHAKRVMESARSIIAAGHEHGTIFLLYRNGSLISTKLFMIGVPSDKLRIAREIVEIVAKSDGTRIVLISEAWVAPLSQTKDGTFVPPGLHPSKTEALTVAVHDADGTSACRLLSFTSTGESPNRSVVLGPETVDARDFGILLPAVRLMQEGRSGRRAGEAFFPRRGARKGT